MNKEDIKKMRMDIGKYLHNYYVKYGEEKYNELVEKIGEKMKVSYGEPFNQDNLRIMEAEYVTFAYKLYNETKSNNTETTS